MVFFIAEGSQIHAYPGPVCWQNFHPQLPSVLTIPHKRTVMQTGFYYFVLHIEPKKYKNISGVPHRSLHPQPAPPSLGGCRQGNMGSRPPLSVQCTSSMYKNRSVEGPWQPSTLCHAGACAGLRPRTPQDSRTSLLIRGEVYPGHRSPANIAREPSADNWGEEEFDPDSD